MAGGRNRMTFSLKSSSASSSKVNRFCGEMEGGREGGREGGEQNEMGSEGAQYKSHQR